MSDIEASLVFVDADNDGDESIELVNPYLNDTAEVDQIREQLTNPNVENNKDREDIVKAEILPKKTVKGLFYNDQNHLDLHKNVVMSKPALDEKIQEGIADLSEILQTVKYETLHPIGQEVRELLAGAITYAHEKGTSLKAARMVLDDSLAIYKAACESAADKFELSSESANAFAEYRRCEKERLEALIKRKNMTDANAKREEGFEFIEQCIEAAKVDTGRVIARQVKEEQEQVLLKLREDKKEIEGQVDKELHELHTMSDYCDSDIESINKSVEILFRSAEAALNKYTDKDQELQTELQENRSEQEKLRERLAVLAQQEQSLEKEKDERKKTQQRAEQTEEKAKGELENWKKQIEELHSCCEAAVSVLWQFKEGSFKLINRSIECKRQEEKRLHELDIMAHRQYRDALVAASVDCKEIINSSDASLKLIKERIDKNKADIKENAKKGVDFMVNEIKTELSKAKENYSKCKHQKAESELKLEQYKKDIAAVDERLLALGEVFQSLDETYGQYKADVEAAWEMQDEDEGGSITSLDSY